MRLARVLFALVRGLRARTLDTMGPLITAAPWPPAPGTPALALTHPKLMHLTSR